MVAYPGLGTGVGDQVHAERQLVELCGLRRVADHEHDGIHGCDRERVLGLVVVDEADELLELVEGEVGLKLFGGQGVGHDPDNAAV